MPGGCSGAFFFDLRTKDRLKISTTAAAEGTDDFELLIPPPERHAPSSVTGGTISSFEHGLCF